MSPDQFIKEMEHEIATRPICEPASGEYVDFCPYSRTGWAVYRPDGQCSCQPALEPVIKP